VWKEVLVSKYGENVVGRLELGDNVKPWYSSLWWKDVCSIGENLGINWFSQNVSKKVGNGAQTNFWVDRWIGEIPLKDRFPRLFSISRQKEATVAEIWDLGSDDFKWRLLWRRRLFVWEENVVEELKGVLNEATVSAEVDCWSWRPDKNNIFHCKFNIQANYAAATFSSAANSVACLYLSELMEESSPFEG
jgi:hypothetical protein